MAERRDSVKSEVAVGKSTSNAAGVPKGGLEDTKTLGSGWKISNFGRRGSYGV